jgi:hypothetical protein
MQLVRDELGQRVIQGEEYGSRISSGPSQVHILLCRHAPQEDGRGKAGHRAVE